MHMCGVVTWAFHVPVHRVLFQSGQTYLTAQTFMKSIWILSILPAFLKYTVQYHTYRHTLLCNKCQTLALQSSFDLAPVSSSLPTQTPLYSPYPLVTTILVSASLRSAILRGRERMPTCRFTPQVPKTVRAGLSQKQKLEATQVFCIDDRDLAPLDCHSLLARRQNQLWSLDSNSLMENMQPNWCLCD